MTDIVKDDPKPEVAEPKGQPDTVSQLFEERDRPKAENKPKTLNPKVDKEKKAEPSPQVEPVREDAQTLPEQARLEQTPPEEANLDQLRQETEALKAKLAKTEKVMLENQRYGRTNAQKLSNAVKAIQKFAEDGALSGEEAQELLGVLQTPSKGEAPETIDNEFALPPSRSPHPFAAIFQIANQELANLQKYTDDAHLPDKVKAFDYFLSIAPEKDVETLLEELTDLRDDPLKLARRMLAIGQEAYEHSYKAVQAAGSFKNYLAQKDEVVEKLEKKIDKLEKKLLQYEDFDQPRYRIDERGDRDGPTSAADTLSTLFEERDQRGSGMRKA